MLDGIFDILETIGGFFTTIWEFTVDFFQDLISLIKLVGDTVKQIPDYLSWLPSELIVPIVALFTVVVLYKILGREG